jgi:putative oxidoreductase
MPAIPRSASPSKPLMIFRWTLQIIVGAAFIAAGAAKVAAAPPMVAIFDQIGIGQWFRYVTAAVEIAGGGLLLWPGRAAYGALLLVCTMVGALVTHLVFIGGNPAPAAVLLVASLLLLWLNRGQLRPVG